jgi:hypothetical protein
MISPRYLLLGALILGYCLTGCRTGGAAKGSGKVKDGYVESFYKGKNARLFFIKAVELESADGEHTPELDMSYDYEKGRTDSIISNFTLVLKPALTPYPETIQIESPAGSTIDAATEVLYAEPKGNGAYKMRFSFRWPPQHFTQTMRGEGRPRFTIEGSDQKIILAPTKQWSEVQTAVELQVLEVIKQMER